MKVEQGAVGERNITTAGKQCCGKALRKKWKGSKSRTPTGRNMGHI